MKNRRSTQTNAQLIPGKIRLIQTNAPAMSVHTLKRIIKVLLVLNTLLLLIMLFFKVFFREILDMYYLLIIGAVGVNISMIILLRGLRGKTRWDM